MERKKWRVFISFILGFIIFNIFVAITSNGYFMTKLLKKDYFLTIELQNNRTKQDINNFEQMLLKDENVRGIRFLSKIEAFKNLQKELEIVIPRSENPLSDSIVVYIDDDNNIQALQEKLDTDEMVREIYIDSQFLQNIKRKVKAINILIVISGLLTIAIAYILLIILKISIKKDFLYGVIIRPQNRLNYVMARNKTVLSFVASSIYGMLLFFNIYMLLRDELQTVISTLILQSFKQLLIVEIVAVLVLIFIAVRISKKFKKDGV